MPEITEPTANIVPFTPPAETETATGEPTTPPEAASATKPEATESAIERTGDSKAPAAPPATVQSLPPEALQQLGALVAPVIQRRNTIVVEALRAFLPLDDITFTTFLTQMQLRLNREHELGDAAVHFDHRDGALILLVLPIQGATGIGDGYRVVDGSTEITNVPVTQDFLNRFRAIEPTPMDEDEAAKLKDTLNDVFRGVEAQVWAADEIEGVHLYARALKAEGIDLNLLHLRYDKHSQGSPYFYITVANLGQLIFGPDKKRIIH